jgi:glycosyltransferase involved in cell wall biosynthesis
MKLLNIFYEEPQWDLDRWIPLDRYLRRFIKRVVLGQPRVGGQKRVLLNLCAGLDRLGIGYQINNYKYASSHPSEMACIIGKKHLLATRRWENPIIAGPALYSHPVACPTLLTDFPNIRKMLVPGDWMRKMCEPYWGTKVVTWPVGIDTNHWKPALHGQKTYDFLLYDKVMWEHKRYEQILLAPVRDELRRRGWSFAEIRYGHYQERDFRELLCRARAMIFLCEHETQGIAYQQALSCGVPILAWDRGGYWRDPAFFPRVKFGPVSSVPYWDDRCGVKFQEPEDFASQLNEFWEKMNQDGFAPRDYILENLTLEKRAQQYVDFARDGA